MLGEYAMNTENRFSAIATNLFGIICEQGYFDLEADYSSNEQCISLCMHKNCYRYDVWLNTDTSTIWADDVQLAFLIALENLDEVDVATNDYSLEKLLYKFELSGFTNVKTITPMGAITIIGTFEGHRILCKITHKDISEQIIALRKYASSEAQRTGTYRGIDPRYTIKKAPPKLNGLAEEKDFDSMGGYEFERFCAKLLSQNGYKDVSVTKSSGDQGIDILACKAGIKYGIQCKCYSSNIGNKAVMEVYAGKSFYGCHIGVVLTNQYYTRAAKDMAARTGIILWDRDDLIQLIKQK